MAPLSGEEKPQQLPGEEGEIDLIVTADQEISSRERTGASSCSTKRQTAQLYQEAVGLQSAKDRLLLSITP